MVDVRKKSFLQPNSTINFLYFSFVTYISDNNNHHQATNTESQYKYNAGISTAQR
jgi:hypothetical protein